MKGKFSILLALCVLGLLSVVNRLQAQQVVAHAESPDRHLRVELLTDNDKIYFRLFDKDVPVTGNSRLGITTSTVDFSAGLNFITSSTQLIDESYFLPTGKKSTYTNIYNCLTARFNKQEQHIDVVFRIYDEGIAYRYSIDGEGAITITGESGEVVVPGLKRIFAQPFSQTYLNTYVDKSWDMVSCTGQRLAMPVLMETTDRFVLLSETMVGGTYAGSGLVAGATTGSFRIQPSEPVLTSLPFKSPWRTIVAASAEKMVESTMPENLNEPVATTTDISWIKPGRAAWNFGGEDTSDYLSLENIKKYIDWAAEMGWEYFTLDKGWQNTRAFSLSQVVSYATAKSVGVFIWVNRHILPYNETQLKNQLIYWKNMGVKGLKIDFWESESQQTMQKYEQLLRLAAGQQLLLSFHSSARTGGLRRTWPHLISTQSVSGNIYYARNPELITASHAINSAIISSASGSADYAPVDFADKNGCILQSSSWAHQLALSVVFESGVQHIMDAPGNIEHNISRFFLKSLPAAWDDIYCHEAVPDKAVTLARRNGNDWYLASLTSDKRTTDVPLTFLSPGVSYTAYVYKDGDCPSELKFEYIDKLTANDKLTLPMLKSGGAVVLFSTSDRHVKPVELKFEAEAADNLIPFGVPVKTDPDSLCSGGKYVTSIGKGRSLFFNKIQVPETGRYALTFYYMADSPRTAFIRINDVPSSWQECMFSTTPSTTGSGLAHTTVFVQLEAGVDNSIEVGNAVDYAPALDRISLSPTHYAGSETALPQPSAGDDRVKIIARQKSIYITNDTEVMYHIFNSLGQRLKSGELVGETTIPIPDPGVYLVKLNSGADGYTKKVIVH